ncbi:MAG: substrate-binding domain-containing protein [Dehalococcoidia bacterium]
MTLTLSDVLRQYDVAREDLAELADVSLDTVNNWCSGRSTLRLHHFATLLSVLTAKGLKGHELQQFVLDILTHHGLSSIAGHQLLPPARTLHGGAVLYVAQETLTKANYLAALGAREYLRPLGSGLLLTSADSDVAHFDRAIADFVVANDPDGIIISRLWNADWAHTIIDAANSAGVPVIAIFERHGLTDPVKFFVGIDNEDIGYSAAKVLLERCESRIGFLGRTAGENSEAIRFRGFNRALDEAGVSIDPHHVFQTEAPDWIDMISGRLLGRTRAVSAAERLLDGGITGIFCASEHDTIALIQALERARALTSLLGDVAVMGVAMDAWADFLLCPGFSYVQVPAYDIGRDAAKLLTSKTLISEDTDIHITLPSTIRSSH